jgi:hypothetical protein
MARRRSPFEGLSASWLLRTNEGMEAADNSGWPNGVDPRLLGVDTRWVWRLVPDEFVKDAYSNWKPAGWCGHPQGRVK